MQKNTLERFREQDIKITREIKHGGQATVYAAEALIDNDRIPVALKLYHGDAHSFGGYDREFAVLSKANHPSIIGLFGEVDNEKKALVLELLHGVTLLSAKKYLESTSEKMSYASLLYLSTKLLSVLAYLHMGLDCVRSFPRGVFHGDLSLDNIFLTSLGEVVVFDFGSSLFDKAHMRFPCAFGKCHYLAPEVLDGYQASRWSDLYSFGAVIFEMATLKRFNGLRLSECFRLLRSSLGCAGEELFVVVKGCLAPSPLFRPKSAKLAHHSIDCLRELDIHAAQRELANFAQLANR